MRSMVRSDSVLAGDEIRCSVGVVDMYITGRRNDRRLLE